jgi:hypothetical protein
MSISDDLEKMMEFETLMNRIKTPGTFLSILCNACPEEYRKNLYSLECTMRNIYNTLNTKDKENIEIQILNLEILRSTKTTVEEFDKYIDVFEKTMNMEIAETLFRKSDAHTLMALYLTRASTWVSFV